MSGFGMASDALGIRSALGAWFWPVATAAFTGLLLYQCWRFKRYADWCGTFCQSYVGVFAALRKHLSTDIYSRPEYRAARAELVSLLAEIDAGDYRRAEELPGLAIRALNLSIRTASIGSSDPRELLTAIQKAVRELEGRPGGGRTVSPP